MTIRTSEGTMRRSGIACEVQADRVVLEFNEVYEAGRVAARSHFRDEFTAAGGRVRYHTTVSDVRASGLEGRQDA